jgi:KaiC/GvpD/RAD55 family RecA-like ATPase
MSDIADYNDEIQNLFLQFLISEPDLFARSMAILDAEHWGRKFRPTVEFLKSHAEKHNTLPMLEQIQAVGGTKLVPIENVTPEHQDWFLNEFETFCKHKALEKAIIDSTEDLENKNYGAVEDRIKAATQIGLVKDLGIEYFANPKERLQWIKEQAGAYSTGWKGIDQKLYGGLNRAEITIFAAPSGGGKSLFLQNLGVNWSLSGLNTVYLSLELSEQLISMRLDSMISGYGAREIMKNMDDVDLKVRMKGKSAGKLRVKQMQSGINCNDIRAFLREYEIQEGIKVDALLVDYLDLMMPINAKISPENMFIKDKYVSEELRNLAIERQIYLATASQLGRSAVDEIEYDHSHIAGGISKINTADNVIGIFTSNAMRERGRYQVQFMKTRSSSGVGSKVDLKFNVDTLRIEDLEDGDEDAMSLTSASLVDQLKQSSVIKTQEPETSDAVSQSLQLRDFLKRK